MRHGNGGFESCASKTGSFQIEEMELPVVSPYLFSD
jgi:hypothetical protein